MTQIVILLFFFGCLGVFARRFTGRVHVLLVAGILVLLAYELVHLYRM